MKPSFDFWDTLAPHHWKIENSFLDPVVLRRIVSRIQAPVLVVGAGQGVIVAELKKGGMQCDGVDGSREMIRYAKVRRGLELVQADAQALPFKKGTYRTLIYATGVIDFMRDEAQILAILNEGKRIADSTGVILVAFYRTSAANVEFLERLGLLKDGVLRFRETLEIYRLNPLQAIGWVAKRTGVSFFRAVMMSLRSSLCSTWQEKRNAIQMQRVFSNASDATALIEAAPEQQPYRNEIEIQNLFARLAISIKRFDGFGNCYVVQI
jgi:ubiquinone/menaquinone biosynthesis C-methylase UbiE